LEPPSKVRRLVRRRHKVLYRHNNRVFLHYSKHKRLVVVPHSKVWGNRCRLDSKPLAWLVLEQGPYNRL
jgi:hypothetical protein